VLREDAQSFASFRGGLSKFAFCHKSQGKDAMSFSVFGPELERAAGFGFGFHTIGNEQKICCVCQIKRS
jgi:hypothetical protein